MLREKSIKKLKVALVFVMLTAGIFLVASVVCLGRMKAYRQLVAVQSVPAVEAEYVSLTSISMNDVADVEKMRQMKFEWAAMMGLMNAGQQTGVLTDELLVALDTIGMAEYYNKADERMHMCVFFLPYDAEELKLTCIGSAIFADYAEYLRDGYFLMPDQQLVKTDIMADVGELYERNPEDDGVLVFLQWEEKRHERTVTSDWEAFREIGELRLRCLEGGIDVSELSFTQPLHEELAWSMYAAICGLVLFMAAMIYACVRMATLIWKNRDLMN